MDDRVVLLTGGAGFIGSHTAVELLAAGWSVVVVDDLRNASEEAVRRAGALGGAEIPLHRVDVGDGDALRAVFDRYDIAAVVHLAGGKAVGESVADPLGYYRNNVAGGLTLFEVMHERGVRRLVFSSSATVYGEPDEVPVTEGAPLRATNPYGHTKLHQEDMLRDLAASDPTWHVLLLRYFNPVGAHPSGTMGEDPAGVPNNLMPFVMQVAAGRLPRLRVFGGDYPTPDGTCLRDYLHVVDLARGHVRALERLDELPGCRPVNLGTGVPYSVLDVLAAAGRAVGAPIPHDIVERRPGDAAATYADPTVAREVLGWSTTFDLDAMCADAWRWQCQNPTGYR